MAQLLTSILEALDAARRLTITELIEQFDMGCGTMHWIWTEDLKIFEVFLSYKIDFYMIKKYQIIAKI